MDVVIRFVHIETFPGHCFELRAEFFSLSRCGFFRFGRVVATWAIVRLKLTDETIFGILSQ